MALLFCGNDGGRFRSTLCAISGLTKTNAKTNAK
jgi:hypothetical protein